MRMYEPVWKKLRQQGRVSITSPAHFHKRIIKAVKKERGLDLEFKFLLSETNRYASLKWKIVAYNIIQFTLHYRKRPNTPWSEDDI